MKDAPEVLSVLVGLREALPGDALAGVNSVQAAVARGHRGAAHGLDGHVGGEHPEVCVGDQPGEDDVVGVEVEIKEFWSKLYIYTIDSF